MGTIAIPESEYPILKKIAELEAPAFEQLKKALENVQPSSVQTDMFEVIEPHVPLIKQSELKPMIRTISSLYAVKRRQRETPAEIANLVAAAIEEEDSQSKGFTDDVLESLKSRLRDLLGIEGAIALASKSLSVMARQARSFCAAKIMSDLRPVFGESPDAITAGMVIHNLNLQYHEDGEHKNFYVAMNSDDLHKLKEAIERAEKKDSTLKEYIKKSGVHLFEDRT